MYRFLIVLSLTMCSVFAHGQKLDSPITIQSDTMYILDLEAMQKPVNQTNFSSSNQDVISFDGEKIFENSIINGEVISIFDFMVESYKSFKSDDEPDKIFYSIIPSKESSDDIIKLTIDNKTKRCQLKTFRIDASTEDIWSIIIVEGKLK